MDKQQISKSKLPYRYPGVQPFSTDQARVFFGRDHDISDLYRLIRRESLVVLYGKSGLGKSSILNAGIIPKSRETGDFNPITVRFGAWTEGITDTPLSITKKIISEGYNKETFLDELLPNDTSLWYYAKTRQLNSAEEQNAGQLLILFDQFEELFTYPIEAIEAFKEEVSELQNTGIPLRFRRMADKADFLTDEDEDRLEEPLEVRQLFGIRSDRMHLLHQLSDRLPNILRNMFELKALQRNDAKDAILLPAQAEGDFRTSKFEWTPAALTSLLVFLEDADNDGRVEGILLQLLCQYFEEKMIEGGGLTVLDAVNLGKLEKIVEQYYFEKIASIGDEETQMAARRLIEEGLVLEGENIRLSLHESQIKRQYQVDSSLLERLVNSRLLRSEPFLRGGYSYELAHDRLVPPVLAAKQERRNAEAEKERSVKEKELAKANKRAEEAHLLREKAEKGYRRANIFTVVAVVGLLLAAWQMIEVRKEKNKTSILLKVVEKERDRADGLLAEANFSLNALEEEKKISAKLQEETETQRNIAEVNSKRAILEANRAKKQRDIVQATLIELEFETAKTNQAFKTGVERWEDRNNYKLRGNEWKSMIDTLDLSRTEMRELPNSIFNLENLVNLDLSENRLTYLPVEIGQLKNLIDLDLSENGLENFPVEIGQLKNLTNLNLGSNRFSVLPVEIGQLKNLTNLNLGSNGILIRLPVEIGNLENLTVLNLSASFLSSNFPVEILQLENLIDLDLSENGLENFPVEIGQLKNLTNLNLGSNRFSVLPVEIGQLKNLTNLNLGSNRILIRLPVEIGNLENLIDLDLSENNLKILPVEIGNLKNLKNLDLSKNELESLPVEIGNLEKLAVLTLAENNLGSLPVEVGRIKNLINLDLSGNNLDNLPTEIGELENLKHLNLGGNIFDNFPGEFGQFKNLTHLYLDDIKYDNFPVEIFQLNNLTNLSLKNIGLDNLPVEIEKLKSLVTLHLENNKLNSLPVEIKQLKNLRQLFLGGNDIGRGTYNEMQKMLPRGSHIFLH